MSKPQDDRCRPKPARRAAKVGFPLSGVVPWRRRTRSGSHVTPCWREMDSNPRRAFTVLIYFGYPRVHEDDAERAVRAGLLRVLW